MSTKAFPPGTPVEHALTRESGDPRWVAALELPDGTVVVATDLTLLAAELIGDYPLGGTIADAVARYNARRRYALDVVERRQAMWAAAVAGGPFAEESEDATPTAAEAPQTLLSTDFAPYTDVAAPTGRVEWVNPGMTLSLLESLHELGEITVTVVSA